MRVGILTFHNTINYGAMLQAFALQETIHRFEHSVKIIDYRNAAVTHREIPVKPSAELLFSHPATFAKVLNSYSCLARRSTKFDAFVNHYMHIDNEYAFRQGQFAKQYDALVVGSDQVWNTRLTDGDMTYFLSDIPNGKIKKVSYAASFGSSSISREYVAGIRDSLLGFDSLSVREDSAVHLIQEISGRKAELVLDPTLLLRRNQWEKFADVQFSIKKKYVFVYLVSERDRTIQFAREAAKRLGAKIVVIGSNNPLETRGMISRNDASIEEFLSLIRNAALVVTSSFHGFALSLALGVNVCFSLSDRAANGNSRLESLASLSGLEDRNIAHGFPAKDIDYQSVDRVLDSERDKSLAFLRGALS